MITTLKTMNTATALKIDLLSDPIDSFLESYISRTIQYVLFLEGCPVSFTQPDYFDIHAC